MLIYPLIFCIAASLLCRYVLKSLNGHKCREALPTMAMNTPGNTDDGQICQNCAEIFTESLESFLSPFVEDPLSTTSPHWRDSECTVKGRRKWTCPWVGTRVLTDAQSSQFGKSPLQCYVCFRTSQLAKMAGVIRLDLAFDYSARDCVNATFEDDARSWRIAFNLILDDSEESFKPSSPRCLRLTLLPQISSVSKMTPPVFQRSSSQQTFSAKKVLIRSITTGYSPAVMNIHNAKELDLEVTRLCRLESLKSTSVRELRTTSLNCLPDLLTYEAFQSTSDTSL